MSSVSSTVVTRFAPSPTGFLHIGGARTALFNWLYARKHGGKFYLRIEDTDRARSTDAAIDAIMDGMAWLGLDHDGEAISQFARADRHREVAEVLLAAGNAYHCYASSAELQVSRDAARIAGKSFKGDLWRDRDPGDAPDGVSPTVRIKMPRQGSTTIYDQVQGDVTVNNDTLDDMILLRSDGTPTYMLSVVVDDHDMGVTHIIRGDDHLNNAFRQNQIYQLMGWDAPAMAHIPLIHGPDGKKLSKRHGALGVEAYRDMGYLPDAMRNYLLRLGWSHGDDEIICTKQALEWFNLENIGRGPARFDFAKLDSINSHYMNEASADQLIHLILPQLEQLAGHKISANELEKLHASLPSLRERAKKLPELRDSAFIFCDVRPIEPTDKAANQLNGDIPSMLAKLAEGLALVKSWKGDDIKGVISAFCTEENLKMGKVMQPLRAALTGGRPSGDLMEIMEILGLDECLARVDDVTSIT